MTASGGKTIHHYEIETVLGRGGMGVVYLARDARLGRKVALKLLAAEIAGDERFRERFLREWRVAAGLDHPNVVPVFDVGEADGELYIAMRYVEGSDLKSLLRREGPLPPQRTVLVALQIAGALDAAHERGLVHRDVKPSNVLIASAAGGGHCYLSDFGLVKTSGDGRDLTTSTQPLGTLDYLAPEQIRGEPLDGRADVYSLGCLIYECLTGAVPFPRDSPVSIVYAHLHDRAPTVSAQRPELGQAIDAVVAKALAKSPADRYAACGQLAVAAGRALGVQVERAPAVRGVFRRRRRALLAAVVATGMAAATAAGLIIRGSEPDRARGTPTGLLWGTLGRAHPAGYRVALGVRFTNGAAEAHTDLGLSALLDDGVGRPGEAGLAPLTGEIVYHVDRRLVDPSIATVRELGTADLLAARAGARIGYIATIPGGGSTVQHEIVKTGVTRDSASRDPIVHAAVKPPKELTGVRQSIPMTIRIRARELVVAVNWQRFHRDIARTGGELRFEQIIVNLFGDFAGGRLAINPAVATTYRAAVVVRACADTDCTRLGVTARDARAFTLPNPVTVVAPHRATYGLPVTFRGTGRPGSRVHLARENLPGSAPTCGIFTFPAACAPRFTSAWEKILGIPARVGRDGRWSLRVALRSSRPSSGEALVRAHPATGRYVAVVFAGEPFGAGIQGGPFTVFAPAGYETGVTLARPRIHLARRGGKLRVSIVVPGGDSLVRMELRFAGRRIGGGALNESGRLVTVVAPPARAGFLEATASVWGAASSRARVRYVSGLT